MNKYDPDQEYRPGSNLWWLQLEVRRWKNAQADVEKAPDGRDARGVFVPFPSIVDNHEPGAMLTLLRQKRIANDMKEILHVPDSAIIKALARFLDKKPEASPASVRLELQHYLANVVRFVTGDLSQPRSYLWPTLQQVPPAWLPLPDFSKKGNRTGNLWVAWQDLLDMAYLLRTQVGLTASNIVACVTGPIEAQLAKTTLANPQS